jgi:hypothetical protein
LLKDATAPAKRNVLYRYRRIKLLSQALTKCLIHRGVLITTPLAFIYIERIEFAEAGAY